MSIFFSTKTADFDIGLAGWAAAWMALQIANRMVTLVITLSLAVLTTRVRQYVVVITGILNFTTVAEVRRELFLSVSVVAVWTGPGVERRVSL